jgi:gliding motility-associated-like protein
LIAFNNDGCTDTAQKENYVNVYDVPVAGFLVTPQPTSMPKSTLQFTNVSIIGNGTLTYNWNFGDRASAINSSTQQNPSHAYPDSGNYTVQLIAISNFNCTDTTTHRIRIDPYPPVAGFTYDPDKGCVPLTVTFTNRSQYANSYSWNFGDASGSTDKDPVHAYTVPGMYNVFLRATGPGGISDTVALQIITVYPLPKANFIASPLNLYLPDATVDLTNTSYDNIRNIWTLFRSGSNTPYWSDTSFNSFYRFTEEGSYSVRLTVTSPEGCVDSITRYEIITVNPGGTLFIPNAFTPNGDNDNDVFIPIGTGVLYENYSLRIYDRWGQRIFETAHLNEGWDGFIRGVPADINVYVWIVEGEFTGGKAFKKSGQVTLIR